MPIEQTHVAAARHIFAEKAKLDGGQMGGCCSYLQRKLQLGYNSAAAIIEKLESEGFLSECDSAGKRRIVKEG